MMEFVLGIVVGLMIMCLILALSKRFVNYWLDEQLSSGNTMLFGSLSNDRSPDFKDFNDKYSLFRSTMLKHYYIFKRLKGE